MIHIKQNNFQRDGYPADVEQKQFGEWQLCPKCNGDGNLGRYNSPNIVSEIPICDVCNGAKIIQRPIIKP